MRSCFGRFGLYRELLIWKACSAEVTRRAGYGLDIRFTIPFFRSMPDHFSPNSFPLLNLDAGSMQCIP